MTEGDVLAFRLYAGRIDASFDEFKLLISILVNEAAEEYLHRQLMESCDVED